MRIDSCFDNWLAALLFLPVYVAIVRDVWIVGILKRGFRTLPPTYRKPNHLEEFLYYSSDLCSLRAW
jgi:hypothetical protein